MLTKTPAKKKKPHPMDIHIGRQIRIARLGLHMSQQNLGDALGLTFQQVQKYEKGTNRVSGSRLAMICKTLKLSGPDALFKNGPGYEGRDNSNSGSNMVTEMLASRTGMELARLWPQLTEKQQRAFLDVLENMVENR